MKHTVLSDLHIQLGAKMQPFAGYYMPVEYSGINDEHINVRERAGIFDVSHMGEFRVEGPDAGRFIQYLTTNDITRLSDGGIQYTCFPNGKGGIVDDLLVYRFNSETWMMVVNAANIEKDWNWCVSHAKKFGIHAGKEIFNVSDEVSLIAVQGPLAMKAIQKLTVEPVEDQKFYTFKKIDIAGIKNALFSVTGYTGSGGCEIYIQNEDAPALWRALLDSGKEYGLKPAGLGARDTLRLEMGYCLYGNDIDETTSPIEAGLGWITRFVDQNDFIDRDLLHKQKTEGARRKLVGFVLEEKGIPRQGYDISDHDGRIIGKVTSGTMSPMIHKGIGMGYVETGFSREGTDISITIRRRSIKARVVRLPFYKPEK
jgi:aminomethyltransferase